MADVNEISTILQQLSLSEDKIDQLLQLESVLSQQKGLDLTEFAREWSVGTLIECFGSKNRFAPSLLMSDNM